MNDKKQINPLHDKLISDAELETVIGANKDLYDKLNELPEIEALDSIIDQEESIDGTDRGKGLTLDLIIKIKSF